jgi:uncharacterized phiE125 gp8 family phage protein
MMLTELTAPPSAAMPVAEFSDHLRLGTGFSDDGSQDVLLETYLRACCAAIEARIGKVLLNHRYSWQVSRWMDAAAQALPLAPVSVIETVSTVDASGVSQAVDPLTWILQRDSQRPLLLGAGGASLAAIPGDGYAEIVFEAGFGPSWSNVPPDLRHAVMLLGAHYYEHRHEVGQDAAGSMPFGVIALIEPYRSVRLLGGKR